MSEIILKHVIPPSESQTIKEFLINIDDVVIPKLSERVELSQYADKLSGLADLFYLLDEQKVVANAAVYLNHEKICYISSFAVLPQYQKMGLGRRLFTAVREETEKRGMERIDLEVYESNEKAERFYRKMGFALVEKKEKWLKMTYII